MPFLAIAAARAAGAYAGARGCGTAVGLAMRNLTYPIPAAAKADAPESALVAGAHAKGFLTASQPVRFRRDGRKGSDEPASRSGADSTSGSSNGLITHAKIPLAETIEKKIWLKCGVAIA